MKSAGNGNLQRLGALSMAFLLPAAKGVTQSGMPGPSNTHAQSGHSYWKYERADVILDVWPCPETNICARVHAVGIHDAGAIDMAKFMWQRDGRIGHPTGPVSDAEVQQVCGYPQVFRGMVLKSGSLQGDFRIEGSAIYHALIDRIDNSGTSNGVIIERHDRDLTITTHIHHIPVGRFKNTDHLTLVPEPPPACIPPLPHLPFK